MAIERTVFKEQCILCLNEFEHPNSSGYYGGIGLELYGNVMCCKSCWRLNQDGIGPIPAKKLIKHCEKEGIELPARNANGFLPIA